MADISEQLLDAMEIIATNAVSNLKYDRTIKATIYAVINVDTGIYQVKYEGNILTVYSEDLTKQYKVDEDVFVKVPEGDFSNKKIITGRVTEQSLSQGQLNQLSNSVIDISPTFDTIYQFDTDSPWKVVAGAPQTEADQGIDYIFGSADNQYSATQYHGLFQQYANQYQYIKIKADFKTQFHDVHTVGNYGLEVAFFAKSLTDDEVETVTCRLDFESESFNGDPYSYSVFSPQQLIFKTQTNYLLGLKYIRLFQEDFEYDTMVTDYDTGVRSAITVPNIFVQNVEINYVDVVDLTQETYYCYIAVPQGNVFSSLTSSIVLEARLLSYGEQIASSDCTYKWFKRDLSVLVGNELYDKDAGFGWAPIENETQQLTISKSEVLYQQEYKCIVIYGDVVMTGNKTVINSLSEYDYNIEQVTDGEAIKLQLVNNKTDDSLTGNWYISYPDNTYTKFAGGEDTGSIVITDYLTYSSLTFYCEVYTYDKSEISGIVEYTIFYSESENDLTISYIGEDTYRYDANGDITINDAEQERTLSVSLAWRQGYGAAYRVEWLWKGESIPTSKSGWNPADSMMEDVWVDITNILHYNIKSKYRVNFNSNTLTVKVTTIDGTVYTFNKEILFVKDGDQGTNGTTYIAIIKPCDSDGQKLSGFQALRYYRNGWRGRDPENSSSSAGLTLRCYVYKDGEFINGDTTNYSISYSWSGVGVDQEIYKNNSLVEDPERIIVMGKSDEVISNSFDFSDGDETKYESLSKYVTVTARINDRKNNKQTTIYALYPIDVIYGITPESEIDISDIPSYIKYTSSGVNPSFYNNNITFTYDDLDWTGSPDYDGTQIAVGATQGISSITPRIIGIEEKGENGVYLSPASSFIFEEDTIAVLKCQYNIYNFILHPIIMYLDTYGNEAINGWDGTNLQITNGYYYMSNGLRTYLTPEEEKDFYQNAGDNNTYIKINGIEYVVYEGEAHILAPQIGAGEKNSNNQFTGVVMGKDTGQDKIGLYGYKEGRSSFGLLEDGTAYFGIAGHSGRIEIDGEKGTITSGNYLEGNDDTVGNGMQIELGEGHIDSYNFLITSHNMTIDSGTGSFEFRIGKEADDTANNQHISDQSKFRIYFPSEQYYDSNGTEIEDTKEKDVFLIDKTNYYLQTRNFHSEDLEQDIPAQGTKIDLRNGKITSYDFTIKTPTLDIESKDASDNDNSKISFNVSDSGVVDFYSSYEYYYPYSETYTNTSGEEVSLEGTYTVQKSSHKPIFYIKGGQSNTSEDTNTSYYLQTINFFRASTVDITPSDAKEKLLLDIPGKGTKIDLENGKITSYDFSLSTPALTLESSDESSQFKFNVSNGLFQIYIIDENGDDKSLFYAKGSESGEKYYLQSSDYKVTYDSAGNDTGKGTRIDLQNGKITSYCFHLKTPYMTLKSGSNDKGEFTFDVSNGGIFQIEYASSSISKNLLYIRGPGSSDLDSSDENESDSGSFYIQSADYDYDSNDKDGTGLKINLETGKITAYTFYLKTPELTIKSGVKNDSGASFEFDVHNEGTFYIEDSGQEKKLFYIKGTGSTKLSPVGTIETPSAEKSTDTVEVLKSGDSGSFYLQSANYDAGEKTGMKIDLAEGIITAYDFTLRSSYITISSTNKGKFVFDAANEGSFQIKNSSSTSTNKVLFQISGNISSSNASSGTSGSGNYFLRSQNFVRYSDDMGNTNSNGMFINLNTGTIYAKNVELSGTIYATKGDIGGWTIKENELMCYDNGETGANAIIISPTKIQFGNNFILTKDKLQLNFSNTEEYTSGTSLYTINAKVQNVTKLETFANSFDITSENTTNYTKLKFKSYEDIQNGITSSSESVTIYSATGIKGYVASGISTLSLTSSVNNNIASLNITSSMSGASISAQAAKIDLTGFVTITNLENGTTTINGGCIEANTLSVETISTSTMSSKWGLKIKDTSIYGSGYSGYIYFGDYMSISAVEVELGSKVILPNGNNTYIGTTSLQSYIQNIVNDMLPSS